ncbi:hypothetical protein FRC16_009462 [Serendipita sp. 398]|nr:hypothetical protein FRC16_009462 [Serendipita sp. 398]
MSYAQVTAHNAPPPSQQPHADLRLLNTERGVEHAHPDVDMGHVSVVPHDFKQHPVTETMLVVEHSDTSSDEGNLGGPGAATGKSGNVPGSRKHKSRHSKEAERKRQVRRVERKVEGWVDWTKDKLFQPAVAGGVFAVVNIGILGTIGYHVYKRPTLITEPRMNARPLAYTSAGLVGIFTLESLAANAYLQTAQVCPSILLDIDIHTIDLNRDKKNCVVQKKRATYYIIKPKKSCFDPRLPAAY